MDSKFAISEAIRQAGYADVNSPEFATVNALTSISFALIAIAQLLERFDNRAEIELEREDWRADHKAKIG